MPPSGTFIRFIFSAGLGDPAQRGNLFYIWIYYRSNATAAERGALPYSNISSLNMMFSSQFHLNSKNFDYHKNYYMLFVAFSCRPHLKQLFQNPTLLIFPQCKMVLPIAHLIAVFISTIFNVESVLISSIFETDIPL